MITIAYNVYDFSGYTQPPGHDRPVPAGQDRLEWAEKIAHQVAQWNPDILTLSEAHNEACARIIADILDFNLAYFAGKLVPGALLTRFEIQSAEDLPAGPVAEEMFVCHWGRVQLRSPSGENLVVHSLHTSARSGQAVILKEVRQVIEQAAGDVTAGRSIVVQGDFNHPPGGAHSQAWSDAGLTDLYLESGADPDGGKTLCRPDPVSRLDYIVAAGPIRDRFHSFEIPSAPILRTDPADPNRPALSDHLPVLARFSD